MKIPITLFLIELLIFLPVSLVYAIKIENASITDYKDTTTSIEWITDVTANSSATYGENTTVTTSTSNTQFSRNHRLDMTTTPNKNYTTTATSCDISGSCTNTSQIKFTAGPDLIPPILNITAPAFVTTNTADITVTTEPLSQIRIYVNGQLSRIAQPSANPGSVTFRGVTLPTKTNTIRIEAEDKAHNQGFAQTIIIVDNQPPTFTINQIPTITTTGQITFSGSVSEPTSIEIKTKLAEDPIPPLRVSDVTIRSITPTSILLSWKPNPEPDILEYGIIRDQTLIATSQIPSFTDNTNTPSTRYSYRIQAIDRSCNQGPISDTIDATTPSSTNQISTIPPTPATTYTCNKPLFQINTDAGFAQPIQLQEGTTIFSITFTDKAGNRVTTEQTITYDHTPPQIIEQNLDAISPSYTQDVTIKGKISEKANVLIFVNDMTKPQNFVTTESDGSFSAHIKLARNITIEQQTLDTKTTGLAGIIGIGSENQIKLQAIDIAGQIAEYGPITAIYALCGFGSGWQVNIGKPSPSTLIPKLILDGFGIVGLNLDLKYQDSGTPEGIRVSVHRRTLSRTDEEKYDTDFTPTIRLDQKKLDKAYLEARINPPGFFETFTQLEKENNISAHRKGECLIPGFGCYKLPMVLEIQYDKVLPTSETEQLVTGIESQTKIEREVFKQCINLEIGIDKRINPNLVPNAFLKGTVDLFTKLINGIDAILKPLQTVFNVIFYTCLLGFYIAFFMDIAEQTSCIGSGTLATTLGKGGFDFRIAQVGMCNTIYPKDQEQFKLSNEQCTRCQIKIKDRQTMFDQLKWFCDRIFCPSAPSLQRWIKDAQLRGVKELKPEGHIDNIGPQAKIFLGSDCAWNSIITNEFKAYQNGERFSMENLYNDFNTHKRDKLIDDRGVIAAALTNPSTSDKINCANAHPSNPRCCGYEYNKQWESVCSITEENYELKQSICLAAQRSGDASAIKSIKGCAGSRKLLNEQAGFCSKGGDFKGDLIRTSLQYGDLDKESRTDYNKVISDIENNRKIEEEQSGIKITETIKIARNPEEKAIADKKLSNDLLTGKIDPQQGKLSPAIPDRMVWIRVLPPGAEGELAIERGYLIKTAKLAELPNLISEKQRGKESQVTQDTIFVPDGLTGLERFFKQETPGVPITYKEKEWLDTLCSFNTEKRQFNIYGCNRFAARTIYDDIKTKIGIGDKDYIVNPADDIASSIKCACLPGITTHLKKWKGIMTAVRNCFNTILTTGQGSPGSCNAVLSRYVCDTIYLLLKCYVQRYDFTAGRTPDPSQGGFFGLGNIGASLTKAGTSVQQQLQSRYGNSPTFQAAFTQQKLVNSICLFAFTGTWNLNAETLATTEIGTIPVDSQPFLFPCERRFLTFDSANQGLSSFNYHIGADLFSGSDVTYTINLKCSQGPLCDSRQGFKDGMCDCTSIGEKKHPLLSGTLKQFENLEGKGELSKNIQGTYRYDRAEIEWSYRDKDQKTKTEKHECKIEQIGGDPPAFCAFDILSNSYRCGVDFFSEYFAKFSGDPEPEYPDQFAGTFKLGERIRFSIPIVQRIPETPACSTGICEQSKYLLYKITNRNRGIVYSNMQGLLDTSTTQDQQIGEITPPDSSAVLSTNGERRYIVELPDVLNQQQFGSLNEQEISYDITPTNLAGFATVKLDLSSKERTSEDLIFKIDAKRETCTIFKPSTAQTPKTIVPGNCIINNNRIQTKGIIIQISENLKDQQEPIIEIQIGATNIDATKDLSKTKHCDPKNPHKNPQTWSAQFEIHDTNTGAGGAFDPSPTISTVQGRTQRKTITFSTICNTEYRGEEGRLTGECIENRNLNNNPSTCYCFSSKQQIQEAIDNKESRNCGATLRLSKGMICIDGQCIKEENLPAAGPCPAGEIIDKIRTGCICGEKEQCKTEEVCNVQPYQKNTCIKTQTNTATEEPIQGPLRNPENPYYNYPSPENNNLYKDEEIKKIENAIITEYHIAKCQDHGYPERWAADQEQNIGKTSTQLCQVLDKGFYEAVKCEGSGECKGKKYRYNTIQPTEDESPSVGRIVLPGGIEPTIKKTIATNQIDNVQGCTIPKNTWVYIKFSQQSPWTGWYHAEDTGEKMRTDSKIDKCHIDIFTGEGIEAGKDAVREFGSTTATLFVIQGEPKKATTNEIIAT